MGRIIPYIMENKKCSKPPTSYCVCPICLWCYHGCWLGVILLGCTGASPNVYALHFFLLAFPRLLDRCPHSAIAVLDQFTHFLSVEPVEYSMRSLFSYIYLKICTRKITVAQKSAKIGKKTPNKCPNLWQMWHTGSIWPWLPPASHSICSASRSFRAKAVRKAEGALESWGSEISVIAVMISGGDYWYPLVI